VRARHHAALVDFGRVIETEQMQEPVREQQAELALGGLTVRARLAARGRPGDHDVPECVLGRNHREALAHREREDIGRPIDASVLTIQAAHHAIVAEHQGQLGVLQRERNQHPLGEAPRKRGGGSDSRARPLDPQAHRHRANMTSPRLRGQALALPMPCTDR
jgi:hypothetical protein